ncbi:MAG: DJ-1/PfpI family protein [Chitinophagaceae bacterium]|nr:DJ-1/PfpI family protein [Chitinophagaceae bacterium]
MEKTKIVFLILPHMHLLDLAGPDQVFHEAIDLGADLTIEYCSVEKSVSTSSHLSIARLKMFNKVKINKGDYVFVPGAEVNFLTAKSFPFEKELGKWVKDAYYKGAFICSICTGAFFLARIGILNQKKCTTHWKRTAELKERYPAINLAEDILFTEDEGVFTSAGVTAGIDMALYIIERLRDDNFSFKVARELVVYMRRQGTELQQSVFLNYRNHIHSGVHKVQDFIQENIHQKLTLPKLAELAYMSSRNLTRIFKKETGVTINEYMSLIRKEYLQILILNPDLTRKQMAGMCGLKSERQVIRLLKNID